MKCINKKIIYLLFGMCIFLCCGCSQSADEVTFKNAYDIYETSKKYQLITAEDSSSHNKIPYFATEYCVSNGEDLGTNSTSSYVAAASGVFNLNTHEVSYSQNIYSKLYPASTTKILTAYVALKHGDLDSVFTVSENATDQESDSSVCNLKAGDTLTLRQLLYGLMLRSGNDAAVVIAEGISGDVASFANLMNKEAKALGVLNSNFVNPNGLQDSNHYTTVYDLYLIFQAAIKNEVFVDLIHTTEYTADYLDANGMPMQQVWTSTNKYIMNTETAPDGITVIGGKTGTTNDAGYCLVLLSNNSLNEQIISIVMKADCRNNLYYYMNELLYGFAK